MEFVIEWIGLCVIGQLGALAVLVLFERFPSQQYRNG
jgi:hypothetical protein